MIIESKRLILRNWEDSDIQDLVEGLNNINVSKWMASVPFPYTEKDAKNFIEYAKPTIDNLEVTEFSNYGNVIDFVTPGQNLLGIYPVSISPTGWF